MMTAIHLVLLVPLLAGGAQSDPGPYIRIDRLSPRIALAYWPGIDRRVQPDGDPVSQGPGHHRYGGLAAGDGPDQEEDRADVRPQRLGVRHQHARP